MVTLRRHINKFDLSWLSEKPLCLPVLQFRSSSVLPCLLHMTSAWKTNACVPVSEWVLSAFIFMDSGRRDKAPLTMKTQKQRTGAVSHIWVLSVFLVSETPFCSHNDTSLVSFVKHRVRQRQVSMREFHPHRSSPQPGLARTNNAWFLENYCML